MAEKKESKIPPYNERVGQTLLGNYIEERAVAPLIVTERSNIQKLSKEGHKNILVNTTDAQDYKTTFSDSYVSKEKKVPSLLGKRRQNLQAELYKIASRAPVEKVEQSDWKTTSKAEYDFEGIFVAKDLGLTKPSQEKLASFDKPITFWTDYAAKGSGTAICSLDCKEIHTKSHPESKDKIGYAAGQAHQHDASIRPVRFCKHAVFSTPMCEGQRVSHK